MRAIWSGAIGFGLVNIPIKMFSATQESTIDLDMLDKHDNAKIRYARINEDTGEEVAWGDIVKGYKMGSKYVVLEDEDYEAAAPKKSQVVEIEEFVDEDVIETSFYEAPYYLAPDKGGERSYVLLREALSETGKVAIGTYVMRGREHLCMLKAQEDVIVLNRLRFAEEIRDTNELDLPGKVAIKPNELKVAKALIDQLTNKKFSIKKYKDTYHSSLMKLIKAKGKGKHTPEPKFKLVKSSAKNLMAQLKASLEEVAAPRKKAS
jgi:DNA end-binding protein Ku